MSKKLPFKRFLNGATRFYTLEELVEILKQTARDRTVQRESVWLWIKDKCHCYMSNVAVGYGKTALLHLIELEPTIKYLKDNCNNSEQEFKYIQHLQKFLDQGYKYLHVDGGNRSDTILGWFDLLKEPHLKGNLPVKLEPSAYPIGKQRADGTFEVEDYITLTEYKSREDLISMGAQYLKLVNQLDNMNFSVEVYSELNENDRRDLFYNLNDNEEVTSEERRNCEISDICHDIRDMNDKYKPFFRDFGWVTKENTLRYKFCAWLGYLSNFYYNGDFSNQMKSWVPGTLDEDYKQNSPVEKNFPKFKKYFEKLFFPMTELISNYKTEVINYDGDGNKVITKLQKNMRYKNLGTKRNMLIDIHMIFTRIEKLGYSLQKDSRSSFKLEELFLEYQEWFNTKNTKEVKYKMNNDSLGTWLDCYAANTFPKVEHRLKGIKDEFVPLLKKKGLIVKIDENPIMNESWRMPLLSKQNNICPISGKYISQKDANDPNVTHLDHIIPRSKGGQTTKDNCQLVYKIANLQKSDKLN